MSKLALYTPFNLQKPFRESDDALYCTETLAEYGIRFEQWKTVSVMPGINFSDEAIMNVYAAQIEQVKRELGYSVVDISRMTPNDKFAITIRGRYLSEHTHEEDEVRFFLSGRALLYIHVDQRIHIIECTKGDFFIIPKGIKHWMDIGPKPDFIVMRWFNSQQAFTNHFTDDFVAEATPRWETIYCESRFKL